MGEIGFSYESKKKKVAATKPQVDQKLEETKALAKKTGDDAMARYKQERNKPAKQSDERRGTDKPATDSKPTSAGKKRSAFSRAFAEARKAGKSVFEWNGKKYTTKLASETKKKVAKAESSRPTIDKSPLDTKPDFSKIKSSVSSKSPAKETSDSASEITEAYGLAFGKRKPAWDK